MDLLCAGGGRRDGVAGSATGCSAAVSHPRISLASGDVLRSRSGHERQHISYASIAVPHRDGGDSQRGADVCVVSKAKDFDSADRSRAGCRLKTGLGRMAGGLSWKFVNYIPAASTSGLWKRLMRPPVITALWRSIAPSWGRQLAERESGR